MDPPAIVREHVADRRLRREPCVDQGLRLVQFAAARERQGMEHGQELGADGWRGGLGQSTGTVADLKNRAVLDRTAGDQHDFAIGFESRAVTRAIPSLLGIVPFNDAFEVRANRRTQCDLAVRIAKGRDFLSS